MGMLFSIYVYSRRKGLIVGLIMRSGAGSKVERKRKDKAYHDRSLGRS